MTTKKKPLLLFPIEIKARELNSRLFLAGLAVQAGYKVIIGKSKPLHRALYKFPRGIIIENDATLRSIPFLKKAQKAGFKVIAWDEEGIVTITDDIYAELRANDQSIALMSKFLCRGDGDHEALLKRYPHIKDKILPGGNPRFDILRPEWTGTIPTDNRPITLLLNSRFSSPNPFYVTPEKARSNIHKKYNIDRNSPTGRHVDGWLNHARDMFTAFVELTEKIAQAFPDYRLIMRPHPSENHNFWKDLASKYENYESFYEGAASDWFLKADCLIHNSCTTAIEASLIGLPSFAYLPAGDSVYEAALPNSVSQKFYDTESIIEALRKLPRLDENIRQETSEQARQSLKTHIAGIENKASSELIFEAIQKTDLNRFDIKMLFWRFYDAFRMNAYAFKLFLMNMFKDNTALKEARVGYANQKYDGTTTQEIAEILEKYNYSHFDVQPYGQEWFLIKPTD